MATPYERVQIMLGTAEGWNDPDSRETGYSNVLEKGRIGGGSVGEGEKERGERGRKGGEGRRRGRGLSWRGR